ncbi:hypothetical protein Q0M94_04610 [Deinococcus radiomollis]|uniref:hypothetical protein n=1 Tax=Deinococcus radiomollis TaxID=468916 RepID=UPI003891D903
MRVNTYSTLRSLPAPEFSYLSHGGRDLSAPELVGQLEGFVGYVPNTGQGQMTAVLYHVIRN